MRLNASHEKVFSILVLLALLFFAAPAAVQEVRGRDLTSRKQDSRGPTERQTRIPNRVSTPLFKGKQGKQKTDIHFDPATHVVTLKLLVQDPNGYFIANIRRDNFVVYENGVRQQNATVEIEHATTSLGVLLEFGGRAPALSRLFGVEASSAARQLLDVLGREDKIAVWKYNDKVEKLVDFSQGRENLDEQLRELGPPEFSDTNLYDALIFAIEQMRPLTGRKAVILISSGIDSFSKAKYEDALRAARDSDTPIYVVSLVPVLRNIVEVHDKVGPLARIDWNKSENELEGIARASGGRAYAPENTIDLSLIYDDMMENLRVRYVITYRSSNDLDLNSPRTVSVKLVDPRTGGPLQIIDEKGRTVHADVIVQDSYVPSTASSR
jgi:VWFA-related protein